MVRVSFSRSWRLLFILIAMVAGTLTPPAAYAKNSCLDSLSSSNLDPALIAPDFPLRWKQEPGLRVANPAGIPPPYLYIAADVWQMNVGPYQYRMYFTDSKNSIKSAWSDNAYDWHVETGARSEGGHPFLVPLPDGSWRMLYGIPSEIQYPPPNNPSVVLKSAFSRDGFNFTPETGYRVGIGPSSGPPALSFAGHGRIWQDVAGSSLHHMVFSGNLWETTPGPGGQPSDLMVATSNDYGLTWKVTDECLAKGAHDPTLIQLDNGLKAVIGSHLEDYFFVMFTPDGEHWSPPRALQFYDTNGRALGLYHPDVQKYGGDVTLIRDGDGKYRMFMNWAEGIISFVPYEATTAIHRGGLR